MLWIAALLLTLSATPESDVSPRYYNLWFEEVDILLTEAERTLFAELESNAQREAFVTRFWEARDPDPEGHGNHARDQWERRHQLAVHRMGVRSGPRFEALMRWGVPHGVYRIQCPAEIAEHPPIDVWRYDWEGRTDSDGDKEVGLLCFPERSGLTTTARDLEPSPLTDRRFDIANRTSSVWQANLLDAVTWSCSRFRLRREHLQQCAVTALPWEEFEDTPITLWTSKDVSARSTRFAVGEPRAWTRAFRAADRERRHGNPTFPGSLAVETPGRSGGQTVVEARLELDASALLAGRERATVSIQSEILRDDEIQDRGQWQLLISSDTQSSTIPVAFHRLAASDANHLQVRLTVWETGRRFRTVATLPRQPPSAEIAANYAPPAHYQVLGREGFDFVLRGHSVEILALEPGPKIHRLPVRATAYGPRLAAIEWRLDGEVVARSERAPHTAVIPLGRLPTPHRLEAVAVDLDNQTLAKDRVDLNRGPHQLRVRLVAPRAGGRYRGATTARARVGVPIGATLDTVDFFVDDEQVASTQDSPFEASLELSSRDMVIRASARLEDGREAEDVIIVNAPDFVDQIEVQWVQLYVSATDRRGRPVKGLDRDDFTIREDGDVQTIRRFEPIETLPIHVMLAVDASESMRSRMGRARQVAETFLDSVVSEKDRAALMSFNHFPYLHSGFTNDPRHLASRLEHLHADGGTALYDSLVYGLFQFGGLHGKRALVLVSDGADEGSRFSAEELTDYANRAGVAIYTISLGRLSRSSTTLTLRPSYANPRYRKFLQRLADDTGGLSFVVHADDDLERALTRIQEDLRSQYFLAYEAPVGDEDTFREIVVDVARPAHRARTIRGYYPR